MDIYTRLKQDHDRHRELAAQIAKTKGDSPERRALWEEFRPEVDAHANAEEQIFYASLLDDPRMQEQVRHSISEHETVAKLLDTLTETEFSSSAWLPKFEELWEQLEHHMTEEEEDVFEMARDRLSAEDARVLVEGFEERKAAE